MIEKQTYIDGMSLPKQVYAGDVSGEKICYMASNKVFIFRSVPICASLILKTLTCQTLPFYKLKQILALFGQPIALIKIMLCRFCNNACIKKGFYKTTQRYYCKGCGKYQQANYIYKRFTEEHKMDIIRYSNEGNSISGISRLVKLSKSTVIRKIKQIASEIYLPVTNESSQEYEIDEMQTFVGKNEPSNYRYIIYAINKSSKKVVGFSVGRRTKENVRKVVDMVMGLSPLKIYTDKLNIYKSLIAPYIHEVKYSCINHIERNNLTLRTHIKRLSRKTICFSRSLEMLYNCVAIYFRYGYC